MRGEEHGHAARGEELQHVADGLRGDRIDAFERLVKEQHAGIRQERHRQGGLLAHAVRAFGGEGVGAVFESEGRQEFSGAAVAFAAVETPDVAGEPQVLAIR